MPGRPLLRALIVSIEEHGGFDAIINRVANGDTLAAIARDMGQSRALLSEWLNSDTARRTTLSHARTAAAGALAEQAMEIADASTPAEVQVSRLQVDTRRWLASKYDAAVYGERLQPGVQVNIGSLHIDSMRRAVAPPTLEIEAESHE